MAIVQVQIEQLLDQVGTVLLRLVLGHFFNCMKQLVDSWYVRVGRRHGTLLSWHRTQRMIVEISDQLFVGIAAVVVHIVLDVMMMMMEVLIVMTARATRRRRRRTQLTTTATARRRRTRLQLLLDMVAVRR